jgi:hypothetical protein
MEIEQIRGVNPFPDDLPAPSIELVLQRLERQPATRSASRWPVRMPSIGGIFVAQSVLVSVAVVVVALSAFGHNVGDRSALNPAAGADRAVVRRVIAEYAIFRRPQTGADRALRQREVPEHTVALRHLTTTAGSPVFVALAVSHSRLTGWLITEEGRGAHRGAGQSSFTPFPLRKGSPPMVEIGRRWVAFVPDAVTRVVWKSYSGAMITTRPHDNVVYGPRPAYSYDATFYAGSRQLIQESVPSGSSNSRRLQEHRARRAGHRSA